LKLGTILSDLLEVKVVLGTLIGLGGVIVAYANTFNNVELSAIVGFVLAGAAFAVTVISAYTQGATASKRSKRAAK